MVTASSKKPPAETKSRSRKAKIIAAAKAHFALRGVDGASTREIAKEAGVAQSLLLYHFATKEDLWKAVMDDLFECARDVINPGGQLWALPARELLEQFIDRFLAFCAQDADLHRLLTLNSRSAGARLDWVVDTYLRDMFTPMRKAIVTGQSEGWIREGDPTLLYYTILAIAGTTYSSQPEIERLDPKAKALDSAEIKRLIRALIFHD